MAGILSGSSILSAVESGDIEISPFDRAQINPVSYDLRLGDEVAVYRQWVVYDDRYDDRPKLGVSTADIAGARNGSDLAPVNHHFMDVKKKPEVVKFKIDPERGWILKPGIAYLMHTLERVCAKKHVPILDGKSSIGRLFIQVHATAGFGDPGFDGQYTLEVTVQSPIKVYPGMRICQIRFHTIEGEAESYQKKGNYKGALAEGPVPSQAWKMF